MTNFRTVKVNRANYRVHFVKQVSPKNDLGMCDPNSREIVIKEGQQPKEISKTLLHELLHAIEGEYHLRIPHVLVYQLEVALYKLLTDNPKLVYDIVNGTVLKRPRRS